MFGPHLLHDPGRRVTGFLKARRNGNGTDGVVLGWPIPKHGMVHRNDRSLANARFTLASTNTQTRAFDRHQPHSISINIHGMARIAHEWRFVGIHA